MGDDVVLGDVLLVGGEPALEAALLLADGGSATEEGVSPWTGGLALDSASSMLWPNSSKRLSKRE